MVAVNNLNEDANLKVLSKKGCFTVFEHQKDLSVAPGNAGLGGQTLVIRC